MEKPTINKKKPRHHVKVKYEPASDDEEKDVEKKITPKTKRYKKSIEASVSVDQIRRVHSKLQNEYGAVSEPKPQTSKPILDSLIHTILSQNTSDKNSGRSFSSLKAKFPTWESARTANVADIESAIKSGGLAKMKSKVIQNVLQQTYETYKSCSLEHLRDKSTEEIKETLSQFKGVGPKTISCVLLFNLRRADFPVDTHVHRVSKRLGWTWDSKQREQTYDALNAIVPDDIKRSLHILMIDHGRKTCRCLRPLCDDCVVRDRCKYFNSDAAEKLKEEEEVSEDEEKEGSTVVSKLKKEVKEEEADQEEDQVTVKKENLDLHCDIEDFDPTAEDKKKPKKKPTKKRKKKTL